jgi:hypothetical protein
MHDMDDVIGAPVAHEPESNLQAQDKRERLCRPPRLRTWRSGNRMIGMPPPFSLRGVPRLSLGARIVISAPSSLKGMSKLVSLLLGAAK